MNLSYFQHMYVPLYIRHAIVLSICHVLSKISHNVPSQICHKFVKTILQNVPSRIWHMLCNKSNTMCQAGFAILVRNLTPCAQQERSYICRRSYTMCQAGLVIFPKSYTMCPAGLPYFVNIFNIIHDIVI